MMYWPHMVLFMAWRRLWMVILVLVSGTSLLRAQDVEATATLEKDTILIGDQVHYTLQVKQDRNLRIWFPEYSDTLTGHIEILEQSPRDTLYIDSDYLAVRQSYLITCFDSGYHLIPGQAFRIDPDVAEGRVISNPLELRVLSMEIDTTKAIYDIKMPYDAPVGFSEIWPYVVMVLLGISIVYLVWRWIRDRRRKRKGYIIPKPMEPAHVIALRQLDQLKEEKVWQNNQLKTYYTRLSEILRVYLENRYFIRAMEETTWEILRDLKRSGFNDNRLFDKLNDLLSMADLVKFAKWKPIPEENETALLDAYIFVNETKPVPMMPDPDNQDGSPEAGAGSQTEGREQTVHDDIEIKAEKNG